MLQGYINKKNVIAFLLILLGFLQIAAAVGRQ